MISKFFSKLKSILFKSAVTPETPLKKDTKAAKSAKTKNYYLYSKLKGIY